MSSGLAGAKSDRIFGGYTLQYTRENAKRLLLSFILRELEASYCVDDPPALLEVVLCARIP